MVSGDVVFLPGSEAAPQAELRNGRGHEHSSAPGSEELTMPQCRIGAIAMSSCMMLLFATNLAAAEPMRLRYEATWAGLPAGEVYALFDAPGDSYRMAIDIQSRGLPRVLTRFRASGQSTSNLVGDAMLPQAYDVDYDLRRRAKRTRLRADAGLVRRVAGDTATHPELAEQYRRDTLDPLAVLSEIRRRVIRGVGPGETFRLAVYDGKRRLDAEVTRDPKADPGTIRLKLMLRPVAGFRNPQDDEGDPEDSPRPAEIVLSADGRAIPLRLSVNVALLPLTVTWAGDCAATACAVALK
jgi:hypothetical protein